MESCVLMKIFLRCLKRNLFMLSAISRISQYLGSKSLLNCFTLLQGLIFSMQIAYGILKVMQIY